MSRLRKRLTAADVPGDLITTDPDGYRMRVGPDALDLLDFRALVAQARAASRDGQTGEARDRYRAALGLWRGQALGGIRSGSVRQAAAALDEEHAQALTECLEAELALGGAGELVGELSELTARYPYREGLHGALMVALYRAGRPADALAAYRHARLRLRDELGTEPTRHLKQLHQAVLNHDPALGSPARAPAGQSGGVLGAAPPRELPPAIAEFTGRHDVLEALQRRLDTGPPRAGAPVAITVVTGTAGVGKTALAVHWAHRVADRFPGGQIYLNLRGHSAATPLTPFEALSALLRSLGIPPEQIPTDEAEAAARLRSLLAGRQVLILLDDADTVEQVRPLLPGSPGCLVLVTSRNRLTGLVARDGARPVGLEVFTPDEAQSLLAALLGTGRVQAEPAAAQALATACAYLPLAMRIAAASLLEHPHQTIESFVAELTSGDRLAALQAEDDHESAVQAALVRSYRAIPAHAQRLFRLLGLVPGPDFTLVAAAALAGNSQLVAADAIDRLASAHLISEHAAGRYNFHDLLRLYAIQLGQTEDSDLERTAAVERLMDSYLQVADAAASRLHPLLLRLPLPTPDTTEPTRFDQPAEALAWFDAERANLVAAIVRNADNRLSPPPWFLADRLRGYFWHGRHTTDWLATARAAVAAAERDGDAKAKAAAQLNLAHLHACLANYPAALAHYISADKWAARAGWTTCRAATLANLGVIYLITGHLEPAADHLLDGLQLSRELGDAERQAVNLINLGVVERERGRLREATDQLQRAVTLNRELGYQDGEAASYDGLAQIYLALGQIDRADEVAVRALKLFRETGDQAGEAAVLHTIADIHDAAGRTDEAVEIASRGISLAARIDDSWCEADALNALGRARLNRGEVARAVEHHRRGLELARHVGVRHSETVSLVDLATAQTHAGEWLAAAELAQQALDRARAAGYRIIEGRALTVLASVRLHEQDYSAAHEHATDAVECHRATGCRLEEARALVALEQVQRTAGDRLAADLS